MANDTVKTTGSLPDNPKGLLGHPPKSRVVVNDRTTSDAPQLGSDGFHERDHKASVKLTTPAKVS